MNRKKLLLRAALLGLASLIPTQAINIAPSGTGIIGVNDAIDSDAGTPRANAGVVQNINDEVFESQVDTWFGNGPTDQGQGVSFVGLVWPTTRYESIGQLSLTMVTFFDGGWFGTNGIGPGAGGVLGPEHLIVPVVQVSTNRGETWTTVPSTSDYLTIMTGHGIGGGDNPNPTSVTVNFSLSPEVTGIDGIRIIGQNGGPADGNGFIGVAELHVEAAITPDADNDGIPDGWETAHGLSTTTNDVDADPDNDGLSNQQEYSRSTHPQQADTDGDGLDDGAEVNTHQTNPALADTDGDTLTDGAEVNTHHSDPLFGDTDNDGLNDGAEVNTHKTDPTQTDTDGDGFADPVEVAQGSDPTSAQSIPSNLALTGRGIMGVKPSLDTGIETEMELYHVGAPENIVDGNPATRVDTWNADDLSTTVSFVGVMWDTPIGGTVAGVRLTLATFFDGGWFGVNGTGPGAGNPLQTPHLVEPRVEITTDNGATWNPVPFTSDYIEALTGHRIGGGSQPNPSSVTATFLLAQPTNNISGIRLIGTDGGQASGGFLGVFDFAAITSSSDSDGDGLPDEWERQNQLNVGVNDSSGDPDSDGLTNVQEYDAGTNPHQADTDGDGLTDGAEVSTHQTNPLRVDSDNDGLNDGAEVNTYNTNPRSTDTDGDGYADGLEVAQQSNPASASSRPSNIAPLGTAIIGTSESIEGGPETPHANAGAPTAINDFDLGSRVDTFNGGNPGIASYVGLIWNQPVTTPITSVELSLAIFFDGGWFGVNGVGPGTGGTLSEEYLIAPEFQVSYDMGTNWQSIAHTSDYVEALTGHPLPTVDFGPPTTAKATFQFSQPLTNITGLRLIGTEGGTASGGFLGVFELAVLTSPTTNAPSGLSLSGAAVNAGQFRAEFTSTAGATHVVQFKNALSDATWQALTNITGDGTLKQFTDSATQPHRFYRIQTQ